ncbi:hypothetical protein [Sphingomonas qomolangmaensis]|uniref:Uncharacterized protein n=1 Tax=Sphingomonas qomolangmaensis TaxID=2918765 RepID=A0ABY5L9H5_9SPHN|nr:hypothetical protein [Sphingomonas qomolangmaensis]UUL82233.1 hypothetical protein NMP03_13755 [Sphingomonas qomolangmaensis]
MSRSYWVTRATSKLGWLIAGTVASGGIASFVAYGLFQQSAYEQEAQRNATDYAKNAADKIRQSCFSISLIEEADCIRKALPEYNVETAKQRHDAADLVAQQRSALWTSIMGIAALIGMALSALGVALVWITFREQRRITNLAHQEAERSKKEAGESARTSMRAIEIAERNAAAAAAQVETMQAAMTAQIRPFMKGALKLEAEFANDELHLLRITPTWQNVGKSVAKSVRWGCTLGTRSDQLPHDFDFETKGYCVPVDLAPEEFAQGTVQTVEKAEFDAVTAGTLHVYFWTEVRYAMEGKPDEYFITRGAYELTPDKYRTGNVPFSWERFGVTCNRMS